MDKLFASANVFTSVAKMHVCKLVSDSAQAHRA